MAQNTPGVILLGMHRSGLSVLAGCLRLLGFNLGNTLLPAREDDRVGAFANRDITLAHDILFRDLGCRWDMLGALPEGWENSEAASRAANTLADILRQQFLGQEKPFAITDPRISRLMPLWRRVLVDLELSPSLILMLRHPLEVARALREQEDMDPLKAHLLWLVHNREALAGCRDMEHALLTLDQLLADPVSALGEKTDLAALSGIDPAQFTQELLGFIRPELKRFHQAEASDIKDGVFRHYAWVYDQFRAMQAQSRINKLQAASGKGDSPAESSRDLAEFPLPVAAPQSLPTDESRNAAEVLDNLLSLLGRYEQQELDRSLQRQRLLLASANASEALYARVHFPGSETASGSRHPKDSENILLPPGEWEQIRVDIPDPVALRENGLGLAPLNTRGTVLISGVRLVNAATGEECWSCQEDYSGFGVLQDALVLSRDQSLHVAATGNDPQLRLPPLPDLPDCPMRLEFWIKAAQAQTELHSHFQDLQQEIQNKDNSLQDLQKQVENKEHSNQELQQQLENKDQSLQELQQHIENKDQSLQDLQQQLENSEGSLQQLRQQLKDKDGSIQELQQEIQNKDNSLQDLQKQVETKDQSLQELQQQIENKDQSLQDLQQQLENSEGSLQQLRQQVQDKDGSIQELQQEIQNKDNSLQELRESLSFQEDLTRQYFHALSEAESEQERYRAQASDLQQQTQLLHKHLQALLESRTWRWGRRMGRIAGILLRRPAEHDAAKRMRQILEETTKQDEARPVAGSVPKQKPREHRDLVKWMEQLHKAFQAVLSSRRWRLGNAMVSSGAKVLGRSSETTSVDRMERIFRQFEEWRRTSSGRSLSEAEHRQLRNWMEQLDEDFQALLVSRRWKLGTALLAPLSLVRPGGNKSKVIQRMHGIFEQYRAKVS